MGPVLSSLVDLQAVENELRNTRAKLKKANQTLLRQQNKISQLRESILNQKDQVQRARMDYDRLDLDRKSREDDIAKMRVALNSARTNKEYSTVLSRINTDKADLSKLEDQLLQIMMDIEGKQKESTSLQDQVVAEEAKLETIQSTFEATKNEIQAEIDKLEARKDQLSVAIEPKHRELFDRLADRYDGEVMAEVDQKEKICGGCYMGTPLELINRMMTRDEVLACPSCGRLLYMRNNQQ